MAQRLCKGKPKARRLWALVRRLLLRKGHRPPRAPGDAGDDAEGEKSGLLSRNSLEQLLVTDAGDGAPGDGDGEVDVCRCAKKHAQPVAVLLPAALASPPEAAPAAAEVLGSELAGEGRGGAPGHRRFVFGGFRRRLLMRRPWRPMLVAIPE
ncbi:hypothetical protein BS78_03G073300 [Paspalum vaginatum]|nr:hypothetical protein BS78_03G073300 [Paspalum vaginatum]